MRSYPIVKKNTHPIAKKKTHSLFLKFVISNLNSICAMRSLFQGHNSVECKLFLFGYQTICMEHMQIFFW